MSDKDAFTNQQRGAEADTAKHSNVAHNLHSEAYSQSHEGPKAYATGTPIPPGDRGGGLAAGGSPPESAQQASAPDSYDAKAEAKKIENLARTRLDTGSDGSGHASKAEIAATKELTTEWASLSSRERTEVAAQLTKDYDNMSIDTLPRPTILKNAKGEVTGLEFEASVWDFKSGPHALKLVDENNKVVEKIDSPKGSSKWEPELSLSK